MHLAFVILSTAAQAGPLRIPGQWNCRGAVEWPTMQQLKRQTGMLLRSTILPSRILGVSMSRSYLLLLNQNECPAARWTMELLLAEQGMTRQQADRDFSDLAKDLGRDNDHFPFVAFFGGRDEGSLFHELFWGAGPAWSSVSLGGWSTFALIGRLSLAFQVHLMEHGQPSKASYQELLTLQHATRRRACCATARTPRPRSCQIAGNKCVRVVDSPCSSSCRLRGWSRRALSNGMPRGQIAASLLIDAQSPDLWNALDKVLLPDSVQICLPRHSAWNLRCSLSAGQGIALSIGARTKLVLQPRVLPTETLREA